MTHHVPETEATRTGGPVPGGSSGRMTRDDDERPGRLIRPLEPARDFDSPLHSQGALVVGADRLAFVSGQVGVRPGGSMGADLTEQTLIAFENVERVLAEADLGMPDVASLRIYLTSHDAIPEFTETARGCLCGHRPASTLLVVEHLANTALLVQVEAIAAGR
ncbi:RidA family protein [Georgenia sp. Z1491]|uniref:RidA family protein n=1 Tax=Georgenia sp. Z1491 TaxID=3416707 RepID=UPI003CE7A0FF